MSKLLIVVLLVLAGCSSTTKEAKTLAWEGWKGRPVKEIEQHPYFKHLPVQKISHDDGTQTLLYRDQTRFWTDAYCQSLGGCVGMPNYNCENAFSVKDGIILGLEQNGSCPGPKVIAADKK